MIEIIKGKLNSRADAFTAMEKSRDVSAPVASIIADVRARGDEALYELTARFDGVTLDALRVSEAEIEQAYAEVESEFVEVLKRASANVREFHEKQVREGFELRRGTGVVVGQKITAIERVGLYVPGGTAAYPSTVLMDAIPAKIAGCQKVVMVTPPMKNGKVNPAILASAKVAGVDEIYKIGGAQAIAALAFGTESVPKVDKIVGPGNAFVAEAKKQVFGTVSIDMIAGPSEIMIVADSKNRPQDVAADLLSQAEHDRLASAVLACDSMEFAEAVSAEIERQMPLLERAEIARASIDNYGKIFVVESVDEAIEVANEIAPEHLELCVDEPFEKLKKVRHAGSVFLGRYCPEALGDYYAGANHTLPTSGTARFSSALSVDDFVKKTQYIYYDESALNAVAKDVEYFATKEGLTAHARSAVIRTVKDE